MLTPNITRFQIGPAQNKYRYIQVPGFHGLRWVCERPSEHGDKEEEVLVLVRKEDAWWACDVERGSVDMGVLPDSVRPVFKLADGSPWDEGYHTWQYNKKAWE